MTWVAWRQHRTIVISGLAVIGALVAYLITARLGINATVDDLGIGDCLHKSPTNCPGESLRAYSASIGPSWSILPLFFLALPVALGTLAGAPIFGRDYEQRTHLFSLTQSISRIRWWATKIAVVGVPLAAAMFALGYVVTWTLDPLQVLQSPRLATPNFQIQGTVLGGYFLLAFACASALGLLLRNTMAAIVLALLIYIPLVIALGAARSHVLPAQEFTATVTAHSVTGYRGDAPPIPPKALVVSDAFYDSAGNPIKLRYDDCAPATTVTACYAAQGAVEERVTFQPPGRFWPLQLIEAAAAVLLGVAALATSVLRLRRNAL